MAENNLNSSGQIDDLNRIVANTAAGLSDDNSSLNIAAQAQLKSAESLKKQAQSIKQLKGLTADGISDLYSFGKSLSNSSGNQGFDSLNQIIGSTAKLLSGLAGVAWPVVGDMIGGAIQGAAEVTKFMTGQFSKAYGNFEKLADTGVIATFQDLREASSSLGLTFSDTEKVLTKYSRSLAVFGKTAMDGRDRFQNIAFSTKEVSDSFRIIGVSSADFAELQLGYIERQTLISRGKNISDKQLAEESIKYMEQLDTLSKLTGISKTELQQQYMDQTRDARYRAWARGQDKTIIDNSNKVIGFLRNGLDPDFAAGIQDYISSGGVLTTEMTKSRAAMAALGQGGMSIEEVRQRVLSGEDPNTITKDVITAMAKYSEKTNHIVTLIGKDNIVTKFANAGFEARNKKGMDIAQIEKDIIAKREADLADKTSESRKLANTRQKLYDTSKTIDLLATGSDTMASIMNGMASGIETVIEAIFKVNGDSLPEYFKIMKQQTELSKKTAKARKKLNTTIEMKGEFEKDLNEISKNPNDPKNKILKNDIDERLKTINKQIKDENDAYNELIRQQNQLEIKRREAERSAGYLPTLSSTPVSATTGSPGSGSTTSGATTSGSPTSGSTTSGRPGGMPGSSSSNTTSGQPPSTSDQQSSGLNRGISMIRELISSVESVGGNYDSMNGGSTNIPITSMTLAQVLQYQSKMKAERKGSGAAGKYQFMDFTLKEYAAKLNMDLNSTMFNSATQDMLGDALIRTKGYDQYKSGKITAEQFLENLSRAWAGLPSPSKGGSSFYSGVGNNKSHISIQRALEQIHQSRTGGIFSGPSTGYLAMLHGDEAVIPANPGSSALEFSTSMDNDEAEMVNVFSMITNKVDRMISLNRDIISTQRKFAVYGLN